MDFRPLDNKCRSEQVAERIMKMIESGQLREGDKLPSEPELARQLGISRGILREGMSQLKAQGIISRKPKDGTYILPQNSGQGGITESAQRMIKISSFRNIMEMRDAIEQKAAVLAVERATDEELEELREIALKFENKMGYTKYWDEDAKAPFLYNGTTFISYDDPKSARLKGEYALEHNMGGAFYWVHDCDQGSVLFDTIYDTLNLN